jgi:hypothetical protein
MALSVRAAPLLTVRTTFTVRTTSSVQLRLSVCVYGGKIAKSSPYTHIGVPRRTLDCPRSAKHLLGPLRGPHRRQA